MVLISALACILRMSRIGMSHAMVSHLVLVYEPKSLSSIPKLEATSFGLCVS